MCPTAIILCNRMDDSLLGVDLTPFEYGTVTPYEMKPIKERPMAYRYNRKGPDGKVTDTLKDVFSVDTLYDFFHHLFAPYSTANTIYFEYADNKDADGTCRADYQKFCYFKLETERNWEEEEKCLLDAIRLFKINSAGFGLGILPEGGLGLNDLYHYETNYSLWILPKFTLNEKEKMDFQKFYKEFRDWYFQWDAGSKDQLTKKMLDLFRNAYRCNDIETAFIVLSGIWELFAQQFPEEASPIGTNVTKRIKESVSRMVRNGANTYGKTQDNLFIKVGYLYAQRSIIVHKDQNEPFDKECVQMAFDITRCLLLKLVYAGDKDIESVVHNLEYCDENEAAYKNDFVRCEPADDELMKRIIAFAEEQRIKNQKLRSKRNK